MKQLGTFFLILFLFPFTGWAQEDAGSESTTSVEMPEATTEQKQEQQSANTGGKVEKIEVTGSHIKRINVEGPSPVLTLDREYLQRSGYNSVADVLRDSTLTATGVGRETSGSSTSGAATTGLRGFGADKILVLLNGNRLPKIGGGNAVDLNLIPFQAIERVEILKDGASAVYGSDALAGVINFILKKDYDGATFMMRTSQPMERGGSRNDIAAIWGSNFSKGNIMAVYQYRSNEEIWDRDREWSDGRRIPVQQLSTLGKPGSFRPADDAGDQDPWQASPTCPAGRRLQTADPNSNDFCMFDYTPYSWALPAIEQHSAVLSGAYDMNESLKLYSDVMYTQRQSRWQYAPAPDIFQDERNPDLTGNDYTIPAAVANTWGINNGGEPIEARYRMVDEFGPRANRDVTDSYGGTVGVKGFFGDTWDWNGSVTYGKSEIYNNGHAGYGDKGAMFALIQSNSVNLFSAAPQNFDSAKAVSEHWIDSSLSLAQWKASGEVANVGSGVLSAAVGVQGAWEDYQERVDDVTAAGNLFGGAAGEGRGSRNYQSFFTEFGLAFQQWEFQLAGRFDNYSDFGSTVNPKFAFRYTPVNQLMFRGSVGTGFKAPTLNELYASQGYGYPSYVDQTACNNTGSAYDCSEQQYRTLQGGNPNLKEETSFSYNLGALFQATRDMSMSVDYWHTVINDAIGIDLDAVMLADSMGIPLPTGVIVNRDGGGNIVNVEAPLVNLAKQQAEGIDFSFDYMVKMGGFSISPHMDHSHYLTYKEEPLPGLAVQDRLGWFGRPRWRNTSYITFGFLSSHSIRTTARTIAGQYKTAHNTNQQTYQGRIATYTEYDLDYRWTTSWDGELSFGVKNVLNTMRPLDDTAFFSDRLNTSLYDQIGQLWYMGYSQSF